MLKVLAFLLPSLAVAAPWSTHVAGSAAWNSNVPNAGRAGDRIAALQLTSELITTTRVNRADGSAVVPTLQLRVEATPRFGDLSRAVAGAAVEWQRKAGVGAFAPVFTLSAGAEAILSHDANQRGLGGSVGARVRQRLGEATTAAFTVDYSHRDTRHAVYDRAGAEAAVQLQHTVGSRTDLRARLFWREGTVLSHATPPRPDLVALARHRLAVTTFDRPFVAYSIRAQSFGGAAGVAWKVGRSSTATFAYEFRRTERSPFHYLNHLVSLSFEMPL